MAGFRLANSTGENEFNFAVAHLFVVLHRFKEFLPLRWIQLDMGWQSRLFKQAGDPFDVALREAEQFRGEPGGQHLADGDGFPVQEFAVAGNRFERVADGVAEIQDRAQTALGLVLAHHAGFDLAAAGHDRGERVRIALEQFGHDLFEPLEQFAVVNDAVFDDFGQAGPILPHRQRLQRAQVAQHKARLIKRADQILARL